MLARNLAAIIESSLYSPKGRLGRGVRRLIGPALRRVRLLRMRSGFSPSPLTIVSGADSTHFESLCQLLRSLYRFEFRSRFVVVDLGLLPAQRALLHERFPALEVRAFDYTRFPAYLSVKVNQGEYAWKPVIVADILEESRGSILWLDAGCVITEPLFQIRWILRRFGFYSPASTGTIGRWTHPKTLAWFGVEAGLLDKKQRAACVVGASCLTPEARRIIGEWKECALQRDCIAPPGSDRTNHRQDQAVLSILVEQSALQSSLTREWHGVEAHRDVDRPTASDSIPS